jgi:2-enoate reductase
MHWGYLLDQFALAITNHRTDEYGGSLENRLRAAKEIVEGIKQVCGSSFPVTMRLGFKSYIKGLFHASLTGEDEAGRTLEEGVEICKLLESYGYDALNVDAGMYDSFYYACPPMYHRKALPSSCQSRKEGGPYPILAGGSRIDDPALCAKAIERESGRYRHRARLAGRFPAPQKDRVGSNRRYSPL